MKKKPTKSKITTIYREYLNDNSALGWNRCVHFRDVRPSKVRHLSIEEYNLIKSKENNDIVL